MEKVHKIQDCNFSERVANIIIEYPIFAMKEYLLKTQKPVEKIDVTEPVILDFGENAVIMFQIDGKRHEIALPHDEWQLKRKNYYVVQILQNPRKCTKLLANFLLNESNKGNICYVKRGSCAMVYLELHNTIENPKTLSKTFGEDIYFSVQTLKKKPNLEETLSKWVTLQNFVKIF